MPAPFDLRLPQPPGAYSTEDQNATRRLLTDAVLQLGRANNATGSVSTSAALSLSTNVSIADSKGVSAGTRASVADSKAVSDGLQDSNLNSRLTSAGF